MSCECNSGVPRKEWQSPHTIRAEAHAAARSLQAGRKWQVSLHTCLWASKCSMQTWSCCASQAGAGAGQSHTAPCSTAGTGRQTQASTPSVVHIATMCTTRCAPGASDPQQACTAHSDASCTSPKNAASHSWLVELVLHKAILHYVTQPDECERVLESIVHIATMCTMCCTNASQSLSCSASIWLNIYKLCF